MRIVHQLRERNANVNFYGWGDHVTELASTMAADLKGTRYRIVPTVNKRANGRSGLMIVAGTPPVDNLSGFEEQREKILVGMRATEPLRERLWSHPDEMRRWAKIIETATSHAQPA